MASVVVEDIAHRILGGGLPEGAVLPTEPALGEEFGFSRSVIREALKLLEERGLGDLAALERCLTAMDAAETRRAFIAANEEFHHIIVASGNADARLADPEPLRGHAASTPVALGRRAGRDRGDAASPPL